MLKQRCENDDFEKEYKKYFKMNALNSKFLLLFHNLLHFTPHVMKSTLKNTCKAAKIRIVKDTAFQELDLNCFTLENIRIFNFKR